MEPISCAVKLHCTVQFLAGGFYHDIQATALISKPSFFCLLWHTMDAINYSESLDINTPRFGNKLNVYM